MEIGGEMFLQKQLRLRVLELVEHDPQAVRLMRAIGFYGSKEITLPLCRPDREIKRPAEMSAQDCRFLKLIHIDPDVEVE